ncbi:MAG TPA: hypothetical protein DD861_10995 [Erythrobacter sp.]|nr:hypothetical protein [Erythrobacter sp.]
MNKNSVRFRFILALAVSVLKDPDQCVASGDIFVMNFARKTRLRALRRSAVIAKVGAYYRVLRAKFFNLTIDTNDVLPDESWWQSQIVIISGTLMGLPRFIVT